MAKRVVNTLLVYVGIVMIVSVAAKTGNPRALLQAPLFQWVTWLDPGISCAKTCSGLGGTWRSVQAEDKDWAMCAGLIDMPVLGKQWVVGHKFELTGACDIACVTKPCWKALAGGTPHSDNSIGAGHTALYKAADGTTQQQDEAFPVKCACTNCADVPCQRSFWKPKSAAAGCPPPAILPDADETYPATVYSLICRSNTTTASPGRTGFVDRSVSPPVCRGSAMAAKVYDILCVQPA